AVDSAGNAYVTGYTTSSNFPTTAGAAQPTFGGGNNYDAFVAKVNPAGTDLLGAPLLIPLTFDFSNTPNQAPELIKTVARAGGGDPEATGFSESAVRYFDGTVPLTSNDLHSAGFGI